MEIEKIKRLVWLLFLPLIVGTLLVTKPSALPAQSLTLQPGKRLKKKVTLWGKERSFLYYIPSAYTGKNPSKKPVPLVFAFHGRGANAEVMEFYFNLKPLAEKHNFIVVYPNGLNRSWNDGRKIAGQQNTKDVEFVRALIQVFGRNFPIDKKRIYALGMSNGGMFTHRLALEMPQYFAAVATLIAALPQPLYQKYKNPRQPPPSIPLVMINGTHDPILPYKGGIVRPWAPLGKTLGVEKTAEFFAGRNQCNAVATTSFLADKIKVDGTKIEKLTWGGGKNGSEVVLYRVINGGHTWPGGLIYMPLPLIGLPNWDAQSTELVWDFLRSYQR